MWDKLVNHDRLSVLDGRITTRFDHVELNGVKKVITKKGNFEANRQHTHVFDIEKLKKVGIHVYLTSQEEYWIYWHQTRIAKSSCPPTSHDIKAYLEDSYKKGKLGEKYTKRQYKKTRRKLRRVGNV